AATHRSPDASSAAASSTRSSAASSPYGTVKYTMADAMLVLADGTAFRGRSFGARGDTFGEMVFNTALTGYQEVLTDPSYHGQIVAMTYPHQGNYGLNDADAEARRPWVRGFVMREATRDPSSWRSEESLPAYLERHA